MKLTEQSEILLARYLLAVERHLPLQGRQDMIKEIRSNFLDTLEDQYPGDEEVDAADLEAQLRSLGSPRSVAAPYFPSDALIAPQYNTIFRLVVTRLTPIVVGAVVFAGLMSFALSKGKDPFWGIWELIGTGWQAGIGVIGTTAVILIILSRFFPQLDPNKELDALEEDKKDWKVSDLPELVSQQDKVQVWEVIVGLFFGAAWLLILLFFFDKLVGLWWRVDGKWHMVPLFTQEFKAFIPWIAVNGGLDLIANFIMLLKRRRTIASRLIEIGSDVSQIGLISSMLGAGTLVSMNKELAVSQGFPPDAVTVFQQLAANNFVHVFLIFVVAAVSIDLLVNLVKLIKRAAAGTR